MTTQCHSYTDDSCGDDECSGGEEEKNEDFPILRRSKWYLSAGVFRISEGNLAGFWAGDKCLPL